MLLHLRRPCRAINYDWPVGYTGQVAVAQGYLFTWAMRLSRSSVYQLSVARFATKICKLQIAASWGPEAMEKAEARRRGAFSSRYWPGVVGSKLFACATPNAHADLAHRAVAAATFDQAIRSSNGNSLEPR